MKTKTAYVHAWEYVNVATGYPRRHIEAGGSGFNWWPESHRSACEEAFVKGSTWVDSQQNAADFYFTVEVPIHFKTIQVTAHIDADLSNLCATAKRRRVGTNVLTYWRRNKFKMGGAVRPAKAA